MIQRLHISSGEKFVEFPRTGAGMMQAKAFRRSHPEFKGKRIKEVIQMLPSSVNMGEIYSYK